MIDRVVPTIVVLVVFPVVVVVRHVANTVEVALKSLLATVVLQALGLAVVHVVEVVLEVLPAVVVVGHVVITAKIACSCGPAVTWSCRCLRHEGDAGGPSGCRRSWDMSPLSAPSRYSAGGPSDCRRSGARREHRQGCAEVIARSCCLAALVVPLSTPPE